MSNEQIDYEDISVESLNGSNNQDISVESQKGIDNDIPVTKSLE